MTCSGKGGREVVSCVEAEMHQRACTYQSLAAGLCHVSVLQDYKVICGKLRAGPMRMRTGMQVSGVESVWCCSQVHRQACCEQPSVHVLLWRHECSACSCRACA